MKLIDDNPSILGTQFSNAVNRWLIIDGVEIIITVVYLIGVIVEDCS